jgi:hypothetical protein
MAEEHTSFAGLTFALGKVISDFVILSRTAPSNPNSEAPLCNDILQFPLLHISDQ